MFFHQFYLGCLSHASYFIGDERSGTAVVVDPQRDIAQYLATGEADDKAGAYGIQGRAAVFVAEVRGSWTNVVGLPVEAVLPRLEAAQ